MRVFLHISFLTLVAGFLAYVVWSDVPLSVVRTELTSNSVGPGAVAVDVGDLAFHNCNISENNWGRGAHALDGGLLLNHTTVRSNEGLFATVDGAHFLFLVDSVLVCNDGVYGELVEATSITTLNLTRSVVSHNTMQASPSVFAAAGARATIVDTAFEKNTLFIGHMIEAGSIELTRTVVSGNAGVVGGQLFFAGSGDISVLNCEMTNNTVHLCILRASHSLSVVNSSFSGLICTGYVLESAVER